MPREYTPPGRPRLSPEAIQDINYNAIKLGLNTLGLVTCFAGLSFLDPSLRPVFIGGGIACINNMAGALSGIARHYSRNPMSPIFSLFHYASFGINMVIITSASLSQGILLNPNLSPDQATQNTALFVTTAPNLLSDAWRLYRGGRPQGIN